MTDKSTQIVMEVVRGPDRGMRVPVPPHGARIGRGSGNDMVLSDPSLSRFHCRVFFRPDGAPTVADLGSTNETLVNGRPVHEAALTPGDTIEIGETVIAIRSGERPPPSTQPAPGQEAIDLGFHEAPKKSSARRPSNLLWLLLLAAVAVAGFFVIRASLHRPLHSDAAERPQDAGRFEFDYEKVDADPVNIFRYHARLRDGSLSVQIDDLQGDRHVTHRKQVSDSVLAGLSADVRNTGFYDLREAYEGLSPDLWVSRRLSVTAGVETHEARVVNRLEPEAFHRAREIIEEFVQNELGLAAMALPPEELIERARDATLQGKKYYDERQVRYGNLARSVEAFTEAIWYLETIEPKPAFYADAVTGLSDARAALQERYEDLLFRSERAVKLRDWQEAARYLRIITEMIPDRADERHQKARTKLLDVERHLRNQRI